MGEPVQLIYSDQSVSLPGEYVVPPGLDLDFASVRAKLNGASASGAFLAVLELLSQDGRIMVQARIDQEFAVGDTGALTWAPFLRRQQAAAAAVSAPWAWIYRNVDLTVADSTYTFAHASADDSDTSDATLYEIDETVGFIDIMEAGLYLASFHGQWDSVLQTQLSHWIYWRAGSTRTSTIAEPLVSQTNTVALAGGTAEFDSRFFSVSDWRVVPIPMDVASLADPPVRVRASVRHESGGNRTLDESELLVVRLGDYP